MKEQPLPMYQHEVSAVLEGRQTQFRRVVKGKPQRVAWNSVVLNGYGGWTDEHGRALPCPYGVPGDLLWVRETWATSLGFDMWSPAQIEKACRDSGYKDGPCADVWYAADGEYRQWSKLRNQEGKTRPSVHMPRWASRITLRVTDVRVERVQEISAENAIAEGCRDTKPHDPLWDCTALQDFCTLWDSINAARGFGWDANPLVWVIEFERVTR